MMQYNPHVVSRVERLAFQMTGDKVDQKIRKHEVLTQNERDNYWTSAIRKAMREASHA